MSEQPTAFEWLVDVANPAAFDRTINQLGPAALVMGSRDTYIQQEGYYVMRVLGPKFNGEMMVKMIEAQGYGRIVKELGEVKP